MSCLDYLLRCSTGGVPGFEMIVGFQIWHNGEQLFPLFLIIIYICIYIYLNISQYDNTLLSIQVDSQHYSDVIMSAMASQFTSHTIVCSAVYSGADQRKHQIPASLAFVWGMHRWPVNSTHKRPVTMKMFPYDDVIMRTDEFQGHSVRINNKE